MERELDQDEVLIGEVVQLVKPVKVKYMKDKFFIYYTTIKDLGYAKLFNFTDADSVLKGFLKAVLDLKEIDDEIYDNLDITVINKLLEITKRLNEIEDEEEIKNEEALENLEE